MELFGTLTIGRDTYPFTYNGAAMFVSRERYGPGVLNLLREDTAAGILCLRDMAIIMAEQGELLRRYQGHTPEKCMPRRVIEGIKPGLELLQLRAAVLEQIVSDSKRQVAMENEDVDLGLLELQEKNGGGTTLPQYLRLGMVAGLTVREALILPTGLVYDLCALYCKANSPRNGEEENTWL